MTRTPVTNIGFAKAGVLCFQESLVLNPSLVLLMKFSAINPPHSPSCKTLAGIVKDNTKNARQPIKISILNSSN